MGPPKTSLQVLHLLPHLLHRHLHLHRDAGEFQCGRLAAQGVGFAVQFLDQEIEPLAQFAAGLEQAFDLVEVVRLSWRVSGR